MFWRLVHFCAIASIVGSAIYAYSVKYETIWRGEEVAKLRHQIASERDEIAALKAEWARLARPERVQTLSEQTLELQPLQLDQIGSVADLPDRSERYDAIGRKLELLGLSEPTATPAASAPGASLVAAESAATPRFKPPATPPTPPAAPRR